MSVSRQRLCHLCNVVIAPQHALIFGMCVRPSGVSVRDKTCDHDKQRVSKRLILNAEVDVLRHSAHHIQATMDTLLQELPITSGGAHF